MSLTAPECVRINGGCDDGMKRQNPDDENDWR